MNCQTTINSPIDDTRFSQSALSVSVTVIFLWTLSHIDPLYPYVGTRWTPLWFGNGLWLSWVLHSILRNVRVCRTVRLIMIAVTVFVFIESLFHFRYGFYYKLLLPCTVSCFAGIIPSVGKSMRSNIAICIVLMAGYLAGTYFSFGWSAMKMDIPMNVRLLLLHSSHVCMIGAIISVISLSYRHELTRYIHISSVRWTLICVCVACSVYFICQSIDEIPVINQPALLVFLPQFHLEYAIFY